MNFDRILFRKITSEDCSAVKALLSDRWKSSEIAIRDELINGAKLPGFGAFHGKELVGLITYREIGEICEIITLDSLKSGIGIGSHLLAILERYARSKGKKALRLITTNDNITALKFYQTRGFRIINISTGAIAKSRELKPEIPLHGSFGIPIRDEIELEKLLS